MNKKILGLDLGIGSIGWSIIENNNKIIDGRSKDF